MIRGYQLSIPRQAPANTKRDQRRHRQPGCGPGLAARWPDANWAVATGRVNDLVVIDIDPRHGGYDSLEEYELNRPEGPLPETLRSSTGGGGRHMFYLYPPDVIVKGDNPAAAVVTCSTCTRPT